MRLRKYTYYLCVTNISGGVAAVNSYQHVTCIWAQGDILHVLSS